MMITTLDSGELNPNARMYDEPDSVIVEEDYVKEEPIFTYQDEAPTDENVAQTPVDSLSDFTEPYLEESEESFDPSIQPPTEDTL